MIRAFHLYAESLKLHNSDLGAYPQRGPGAGGREEHKPTQDGWREEQKMLPGMQPAREAPFWPRNTVGCAFPRRHPGSARWHGPGAH